MMVHNKPVEKKQYYTWADYNQDVEELAKRVADYKPKLIIGLARGGLVPAVHLSHLLSVPMEPLWWSTRDSGRRDLNLWMQTVGYAFDGNNVLIVDDIVDSGTTIKEMYSLAAKYHARKVWGNYVKTAVLFLNTYQENHKADFYINPIDKSTNNSWICYPWGEK